MKQRQVDRSRRRRGEEAAVEVTAPRRRQARAEARSAFVERVFAIVRRIPPGKVTTYGRIARAVGAPRSARMVGWSLHHSPPDVSEVAHRVVNRNGELTGGWSWGHPAVMRGLLEDEGVTFVEEYQVDLARHLWEPEADDAEPESDLCGTSG